MLSKRKVLHLALALSKAGDIDLLKGNGLLSDQGLSADDKERVNEIGHIVHTLCQDYSYVQSRAFDLEVAAKSASLIDMKIKIEAAATKRKERLEALYAGIRGLADKSVTLFDLVPEDQQPLAIRLQDLFNALTIPTE